MQKDLLVESFNHQILTYLLKRIPIVSSMHTFAKLTTSPFNVLVAKMYWLIKNISQSNPSNKIQPFRPLQEDNLFIIFSSIDNTPAPPHIMIRVCKTVSYIFWYSIRMTREPLLHTMLCNGWLVFCLRTRLQLCISIKEKAIILMKSLHLEKAEIGLHLN